MKAIEKIKWLNRGIRLGKRDCEVCQNLTEAPVGEGTQTAEIYCGDEDRAAFLVQALGELGIKAECEIYTVDGEYHVEVRR